MHVLINVKSPNNISKWQMGFNSAFKGLSKILVCGAEDMIFILDLCLCLFVFLDLLTACKQDAAGKLSANLYDINHCYVYSVKLLTMDTGNVRNMLSFIPIIHLKN
jgi:hypothetical protein